MDFVNYEDNEPWPTEPDGSGKTLELVNPQLDNSLARLLSSCGLTNSRVFPDPSGSVGHGSLSS